LVRVKKMFYAQHSFYFILMLFSYSSVDECRFFYVRSITDQSFPDAGSSNITVLPLFMPILSQELVFLIGWPL
jgi:hypothetical protein